jgi:tetratricopeptide (TPR) repeat protein
MEEIKPRETIEYQLKKNREYLDLHNLADFGEKVTRNDLLLLRKDEASHIFDLNMGGLGLTDVEIEPISGLKLKQLGLDKNHLKDLHALKGMTSLKSIRLSDNDISSEGMHVIATLSNLMDLELQRTPINNSDLINLYDLKNLHAVNLGACPKLTLSSIERLRAKQPNCVVFFDSGSDKRSKPAFDALTNIKATLMSQSEFDEADLALAQTISRWEKEANPRYEAIAQGYRQRAECREKLKQPKAQVQMLMKSLEVYCQHMPGDPDIPSIEYHSGKLLDGLDEKKAALAMYEKADAFWQKHPPPPLKRGEFQEDLRRVGYLLASPTQYRQARVFFERALNLAKQYTPGDSAQIAAGKQGIAWCHFQAADYKSAVPLLREVLSTYEGQHDQNAQSDASYMLAQCYAKQGDLHGAEALLKRTLDMSISDHHRAICCDEMVKVLQAQNKKEEAKHYSEILFSLTGKR